MTPLASRLADALVNSYRIERELGAGGMATVYLAHDLRHERQVALKVLKPELAASLGSERFSREIQLAARLQHPHILPLLDSGEAGGFLYFVMPYVEGESLRQRLQRIGELPVQDAVKILAEVVDALAYAHGQGVVHRDIKPDNVMLSGRHALVTDFGVAKAVSEATGRHTLTSAGVALGTPAYMAPEQAAADPHLDHRVDIYAVGVMGYELLAGRPPFVGMTSQQVLAAHVTQKPEPLSTHRPACPPALEAVLMRCLEKRAADRWQSAEELLQQLETLATPSGGMTPTQTRPVSALPPTRPRWIVLASAGLVVLAILTLGWSTLRRRAPASAMPLEKVQLTFTGNAATPGISLNGSKVAYTTRQCDSTGRCALNIVVQDVAGAGTATVLRGALGIWTIRWTPDERYLVFNGSFGAERWGTFSVPSLGGEPRSLGCCNFTMRRGDTVLVARAARGADSVAWLRWLTAADGIVRDSLAIALEPERLVYAEELSEGRGLVLTYMRRQSQTYVVTTRDGRITDSISFSAPSLPAFEQLTPERDRIMTLIPRPGVANEYDELLFRVDGSLRIVAKPDTVARQLTIANGGDIQGGTLVYDYGPSEYSVWAMTRSGAAGMKWVQRRLAVATAPLHGSISTLGDRVLLGRGTTAARGRIQLSVMPFDSGPETPLGLADDLVDWGWSQDDRSVVIAARRGADSAAILQVDVATGRTTPTVTFESSDFESVKTLPGGGILLLFPMEFRRIGVAGLPDSSFPLPGGRISAVDPSPDGRELVAEGWNTTYDTVLIHRISLLDGSATRLATLIGEEPRAPRWISDGAIIAPVVETAGTMAWYRIPSAGGAATRLGAPPRFPAEYGISANGLRAVATAQDQRTDIYMIRNFGSVLKAK